MMHTSLSVQGQTVLITGASRGIGRGLALGYAQAGADVLCLARPSEALSSLVNTIKAEGGAARAIEVDLTCCNPTALVQSLPDIDAVIHAAGVARHRPLTDMTREHYAEVMALNVEAPLFLTQAITDRWIVKERGGSIVFISSQLAHVGAPQRALYCGSKSALEGLSRALAIELAPQRIRVNTICPTFTRTEMTAEALSDPAFRASVIQRIPMGRLGEPSDYLGACLLLTSSAGQLITGSSLRVDGGWTAQ
ncbi:MAG: SDR family oxidoreductase [Gammaproteobacteria bacterium]|nr:SDR family oxidoreductase [Gammaproteobacteria bacterium]